MPCSASVDEQLDPLSALIRGAGGSPRDVPLTYPGLVAVPVAHLAGARHVLRQLGCADEGVPLMLVSLPDLCAQLADALHRLFQGTAGGGGGERCGRYGRRRAVDNAGAPV